MNIKILRKLLYIYLIIYEYNDYVAKYRSSSWKVSKAY